MRTPLSTLDGAEFDVVIVGGGISGASSAQYLAAAGYRVLLVEKHDYASAATSRSGRILHCGLRYLAPAESMTEFVAHPSRLKIALNSARKAVETWGQFVRTTPERLRPLDVAYPIYRDAPYSGWQVDIGAKILQRFNRHRVPLHYRRMRREEAQAHPFIRGIRDPDRLSTVVMFRDYRFEWPERICIDEVLEAQELGATLRNYTRAIGLRREPQRGWSVLLEDTLEPGTQAHVKGTVVLNMAGAWIDELIGKVADPAQPSRKIRAVKGSHIVVRLPRKYRGHGIAGFNREKEQIFCLPWDDERHYIGPTETIYDGDLDDVHPTEADNRFLLDEINHFVPALDLKAKDIEFTWAGARPITYDPVRTKGKRLPFGVLHDLTSEGLPDLLTLTWAAIMSHRAAAEDVVRAVRQKLEPPRPARPLSFSPRRFPENTNSPALLEDDRSVTIADLRFSAEHEQPRHLPDLLFRRVGLGWRRNVPRAAVERAAAAVADILGWDEAQVADEVESYCAHVAKYHPPGEPNTAQAMRRGEEMR